MLTFAALAIAFLLRPIGGVVFGIIGDKYGRKVINIYNYFNGIFNINH